MLLLAFCQNYSELLRAFKKDWDYASINGFLVCFYVEVYGAELIARSAHFPTIHLTFLDRVLRPKFFSSCQGKRAIWQLEDYAWFSLFNNVSPRISSIWEDQKRSWFFFTTLHSNVQSQRVISFHSLLNPLLKRVVVKSKGALAYYSNPRVVWSAKDKLPWVLLFFKESSYFSCCGREASNASKHLLSRSQNYSFSNHF